MARAVHQDVVGPEDLSLRAREIRIAGESRRQRGQRDEIPPGERQRMRQPFIDRLLHARLPAVDERRRPATATVSLRVSFSRKLTTSVVFAGSVTFSLADVAKPASDTRT